MRQSTQANCKHIESFNPKTFPKINSQQKLKALILILIRVNFKDGNITKNKEKLFIMTLQSTSQEDNTFLNFSVASIILKYVFKNEQPKEMK